jgi:hypothetical protein
MANERASASDGIYHIRVKGSLDERWADWFDGFVMASRENGETLLSGSVVDQAALHGVLGKIRGLGLPLLMVKQAGCPCTNTGCSRHGNCQECGAHYALKGKHPYCLRTKTKWDRECAALAGQNGKAEMRREAQTAPRCESCAVRKRAEAKPKSLLGRLWYWHIKWCPGWKSYQEHLEHHKA